MYKMRKRKDAFFEQRKWLRMDELMASARPSGASIGRERAGSPRNRFATYSVPVSYTHLTLPTICSV